MKTIIFDCDGVLLDSAHIKTEAFLELFKDCTEEQLKEIKEHHERYGGYTRYYKIQHYSTKYRNKSLNAFELAAEARKFSDIVLEKVKKCNVKEGVVEFLEKNHRELDMHVVSGTPIFELDEILKAHNLRHYFKSYYGTNEYKGKTCFINFIMEDYDREGSFYIGDALSDFEDAIEADLDFVGVVDKKNPFPENVLIIKNLNQLKIGGLV